jgi:ribosomal-protein-alanine N-acetyltransferase
MEFSALPESAHELVLLRPIGAEDLPAWYAYLSEPAVYEHTSWNVQSPQDLARHIWQPDVSTPSTDLRLAIALRSTNQLVGTAGFHTVSPQNRSAELAFDLSPAVWGRGIATCMCSLLTQWAHSAAGVVRVQATVLHTNARSGQVLRRCGFEREGLLRSYRMVRGQPGDFWMWGHVVPDSRSHPTPPPNPSVNPASDF